MNKEYIQPTISISSVFIEQTCLAVFSQVDNDGDGITDQRPIHEGDPEDGDVGAKPEIPLWEVFQSNVWDD